MKFKIRFFDRVNPRPGLITMERCVLPCEILFFSFFFCFPGENENVNHIYEVWMNCFMTLGSLGSLTLAYQLINFI